MINHNYSGGLSVDIGLLRNHISMLLEERKNVARLHESISAMRKCCPPDEANKYNSLLCDVDQLMAYFYRMAAVLSEASDEAVHLSHKIGYIIEEDTLHIRHTVWNTFML